MTEDEVGQIMFRIRAVSPMMVKLWDQNPEAALEMWTEGIGDLPYDDVKAAVVRWIQENQQPPTIADLRRSIADHLLKIPAPGSALAIAKAWVQNGETGRCPKIIMYALDRIGRPRQVRALSDFAFEKAFAEAWAEVERETRSYSLSVLPELLNDPHQHMLAGHLSLAPGESNLKRLEDA